MSFTDTLRDDADEVWRAIYDHPMVEGIGDGTLDEERFRYWLKQDYVYLVDYCRLFAFGVAQAPTVERMGTFAALLSGTLDSEMAQHREYAADFGLSASDLEETTPSPTTRAYTDFLVRTASTGTFGDLVAALLPCMWGFNDTGRRLREDGLPDEERYAEWIRTYSGEEFTELTEWCKGVMDEVAAESTPADHERYRDLFLTSARYEYEFWDAAWRLEEWSV
jgi:thiaminase/transcriptional activator TenA